MYACQLFALCVVLLPRKKISWLNAVAWLLAGYSSVPAIVHLSYNYDEHMRDDFKMWPWLTGGIIYAVGAILYVIGFPERCFPGTFDIIGHSH